MKAEQSARAQMEGRIALFSELSPIPKGYLDTVIPGHARTVYNVIGKGVTEDPSHPAAIAAAEGFNMTYVKAEPGNGGALHSHTTVEVFIPISGRWTFFWGDEGEHEVELGPLDVISIPAEVMRGFRNTGESTALLIAIQGGTDPGRVMWPTSVIEKAREYGLEHDDQGNLNIVGQAGG